MFARLIAVSVVALCVGAGVTAAQTAQVTQALSDTYVWHGELVSFEPGTGTFTVKARVLSDVAKEAGRFNVGDRVLVTWSGMDKYADDANQKVDAPFSFAVEIGSRDVQNDYMTFKFRAPQAASAAVKAVKPGEWITITTRQRPASEAQAIVSVEPYVKSASQGTK
jgi:hypothetical protein